MTPPPTTTTTKWGTREWSLITESRGGGASKRDGGGGGKLSFGVVFQRKLDVLAILKRGAKSFYPLEGGMLKFLPCLGGWGKVSDRDFPIL